MSRGLSVSNCTAIAETFLVGSVFSLKNWKAVGVLGSHAFGSGTTLLVAATILSFQQTTNRNHSWKIVHLCIGLFKHSALRLDIHTINMHLDEYEA